MSLCSHGAPSSGEPRPRAMRTRRRPLQRPAAAAFLVAVAVCCLGARPVLLLGPLAAAPVDTAAEQAGESTPQPPCEELQSAVLKKADRQMISWEKAATEGRTILRFGGKSGRFLNKTLASFDTQARSLHTECAVEREALEQVLKQQLHSIFLVQRSTIEQVLYQRLKKDLLRRMAWKKSELDVKTKLKMLHSSMKEYDSQVKELLPFFVENTERDRAETRLSQLQWGIGDTQEATEMKQRWKMNRMRKMQMRQSQGFSVSLSPGMRLMFRPSGFGNLQMHSKRQVGPPHNPNEVSIAMLNDGKVIDIYNEKPSPPLIKFQPTIGIDVSAG